MRAVSTAAEVTDILPMPKFKTGHSRKRDPRVRDLPLVLRRRLLMELAQLAMYTPKRHAAHLAWLLVLTSAELIGDGKKVGPPPGLSALDPRLGQALALGVGRLVDAFPHYARHFGFAVRAVAELIAEGDASVQLGTRRLPRIPGRAKAD